MKNKILIIFGLVVTLFCNYSCSREVDDVFDQSASDRTEQALTDYRKVLCESSNGWIVEYFANTTEAGCLFLMKFDTNGSVKIAGKNQWIGNKYTEAVSAFEMIADNGPVLSFNTYNEVLHIFSTPEDVPGTAGDQTGHGHEGDYEFVVMSADANGVILHGKKRKIEVIMRPLPADYEWEGYFKKVDEVQNQLFSDKLSYLYLSAGGEKYVVNGAIDHEISLYPFGGDAITQTSHAIFLLSERGIRFCTPYGGENDAFAVQNFKIAEDGSLVCTDEGQDARIYAEELPTLFTLKEMIWRLDASNMGGAIATAYQAASDACKTKYKYPIAYSQFSCTKDVYSLSFKVGSRTGLAYFKPEIVDGKVKFIFDGTSDANATKFISDVPALQTFIDCFNGLTFTLTSESAINPSTILLSNSNSANDNVSVIAQ
ncbi:MAG: DUF4302 domain-containing protein [Muribaculaceae bacterium]|nr:DUF4302 domain-containing protein [Muribaculaceae bacterium]